MTFIELAASLAGGGAAGAGVAAYLTKQLLLHRLTKDLEIFRLSLQERTEALKSELSVRAHEASMAVTRVDARRADAVEKLHAAQCAWTLPTSRLVGGGSLMDADDETLLSQLTSDAEQAHQAGITFMDVLAAHAVYLRSDTYSQVAEAASACGRATAKFLRPIRAMSTQGAPPHEILATIEAERGELAFMWTTKLTPILKLLIQEYRVLLGVETKATAS